MAQFSSAGQLKEAVAPTGEILDPLFGIPVAWGNVPFEKAPNSVYSCRELADQPRGYLFVFASAVQKDVSYELIHGWELVKDDEAPNAAARFEQNVTATIAIIKNGQCVGLIADGFAWSSNPKDRDIAISRFGITEKVATAMLDDGFLRAVAAFGGPATFLKRCDQASAGTPTGQLDYLTRKISDLRKTEVPSEH